MMGTRARMLLLGAAWVVAVSSVRAEVAIEWVQIGHLGNRSCSQVVDRGNVDYVYSIGKFEITAGQYTEFLNAVAFADAYELWHPVMAEGDGCQIVRSGSQGSYTYTVAPDRADRPVAAVNWGDAARFCNWLHNGQPTGFQNLSTTEGGAYFLDGATTDEELTAVVREPGAAFAIPSDSEWYKAAYYDPAIDGYYMYATGTDEIPSHELIDPDPGNHATYRPGDFTIGAPYLRTEVGAHENSASPLGTFDQSGNVMEWTERVVEDDGVGMRGTRGGSYAAGAYQLRATVGYEDPPSFVANDNGFRVVMLSEPVCGNGGWEWWAEACDDGNSVVGDGCGPDCTLEVCGDGVVDALAGEMCDDGNLVGGDGCDPYCRTEVCGNGAWQLELGEQCDDGNTSNDDGCRMDCTVNEAWSWVTIGHPGNAANTFCHPWGAVDYVYEIGKFEVTTGQYVAFLNAVAADDPYELYDVAMEASLVGCQIRRQGAPGGYTYTTPPDWAKRPVNYVTWASVARYCNWLHNGKPVGACGPLTTEQGAYDLNGAMTAEEVQYTTRTAEAQYVIPTIDEWYKAAYYHGELDRYFYFPTIHNQSPHHELVDPDPGNHATFNGGETQGDPNYYTIGRPYYRTEVGAHEHSASPFGTFDQGGNVSEITETWKLDNPDERHFRSIGGSYYFGRIRLQSGIAQWAYATNATGLQGFRVVRLGTPECGDGVLQIGLGEQCDDGNLVDGDGCESDCTLPCACGDDIVNPYDPCNEWCDDGNVIDGDGCSADCLTEVCGNGILQAALGEECDDGNLIDDDGCSSLCLEEICGDGIIQEGLGEQCDDGNQLNGDWCTSDCQLPCVCGDGLVNDLPTCAEFCDDGNLVDDDGCDADCTLSCICGDGLLNPYEPCNEACDDGNDIDDDLCSNACTINGIPCTSDLDCVAANDDCCGWDRCGGVTPGLCDPPIPAMYADVCGTDYGRSPNGTVNLTDILCTLNAFGDGNLGNCPNADVAVIVKDECPRGNGIVNLTDILKVIDAFGAPSSRGAVLMCDCPANP